MNDLTSLAKYLASIKKPTNCNFRSISIVSSPEDIGRKILNSCENNMRKKTPACVWVISCDTDIWKQTTERDVTNRHAWAETIVKKIETMHIPCISAEADYNNNETSIYLKIDDKKKAISIYSGNDDRLWNRNTWNEKQKIVTRVSDDIWKAASAVVSKFSGLKLYPNQNHFSYHEPVTRDELRENDYYTRYEVATIEIEVSPKCNDPMKVVSELKSTIQNATSKYNWIQAEVSRYKDTDDTDGTVDEIIIDVTCNLIKLFDSKSDATVESFLESLFV